MTDPWAEVVLPRGHGRRGLAVMVAIAPTGGLGHLLDGPGVVEFVHPPDGWVVAPGR